MKISDPQAAHPFRFFEPDIDRLASAAHYVIYRTEPAKLGATKLNKILWYADLENYRRTGQSITGERTYVRLPRGPVPHRIDEALDLLKREGKIVERRTRVHDYDRREFVWIESPNIEVFSAQEIDTVNVFIDLIKDMTADQISSITHEDALWLELTDGEAMPVGAGSIISRPPTERELMWAMEQISKVA